ncbi:piggyBac transposable element-derived protein 4-like [Metopolophium dirhodum]|uniref:piggyBac transposable element-derived protein 4-like n=1 Tax=Metopolophium dirhodum TaxID=44670 RepID=UPI0029906FCE|nr:piggyBac transposable element-derived protein 4-like [Metopolophium dirhodum]
MTVTRAWNSFEDSDSDDDNIELEFFIGKDKATKWSKTPLTIQKNYKRDRDAKFITKNEMMAFFGLLFLSGIKKGNHTNFLELWATDGTGIEVFRACMSCNRFLFILNSIRFDDRTTRNYRRSEDKLTAVRSMLDQFVYNCKTSYCLSEYLTIDEMLAPFRGRCSFIQYIPSKPAKYGLKIFALVDAKSFYRGNLEIYCGTQPDGPYNMSSKPFDIVMRLLDNVTGSNRNLTCDNWYTSYPLATELLKKQTTIVGTLRKNKKEIPVDFQPHKNKAVNSSFFGFQKEIMITSYTPKKNKAVILLSTMNNDTSVNSETKKPEVILFYNSTKGGVDTVDQMCGNYSVSRRTRRWPLSIFFQLLNIAEVDVQEPPTKIRSRCYLCGRAKNRVTTIKCSSCQKFTCKEHVKAVVICE